MTSSPPTTTVLAVSTAAASLGLLVYYKPNLRQHRMQLVSTIGSLASSILSVAGFLWATLTDLSEEKAQEWKVTIDQLMQYLENSGIGDELYRKLNERFLTNLLLLRGLQEDATYQKIDSRTSNTSMSLPSLDEARRVIKFATASYGVHIMAAVEHELVAFEKPQLKASESLLESICRYTGIPSVEDVWILEYEDTLESLRHVVTVDHARKQIILAIRGTLTLSGVVVDLAGFAESFCGGEAHAGMAKMARAVWEKASSTLKARIEEHVSDYELVVTGHSLGAGVACLITFMVFHEKLVPDHVKVRCFAYAPPPVFASLSAAPEAMAATTAYVHANDVVPSLSIHSIRKLCGLLEKVDDTFRDVGLFGNFRLNMKISRLHHELVGSLDALMRNDDMVVIQGAPTLAIPAHAVVWLRNNDNRHQ
jgi:hypothetical protein